MRSFISAVTAVVAVLCCAGTARAQFDPCAEEASRNNMTFELYMRYGCRGWTKGYADCHDGDVSFSAIAYPRGNVGEWIIYRFDHCPAEAPVCDAYRPWFHAYCGCGADRRCVLTEVTE